MTSAVSLVVNPVRESDREGTRGVLGKWLCSILYLSDSNMSLYTWKFIKIYTYDMERRKVVFNKKFTLQSNYYSKCPENDLCLRGIY